MKRFLVKKDQPTCSNKIYSCSSTSSSTAEPTCLKKPCPSSSTTSLTAEKMKMYKKNLKFNLNARTSGSGLSIAKLKVVCFVKFVKSLAEHHHQYEEHG